MNFGGERVEQEAKPGRMAVGHPVDVASGELFHDCVDFELDGVVPLELGRRYSTHARDLRESIARPAAEDEPEPLPFGPGWHASWDWRLRRNLSGFHLTKGDGTGVQFYEGTSPETELQNTGHLANLTHGMELVRLDAWRVRLVRFGIQREAISHVFVWSQTKSRFFLERIERTGQARIDFRYDSEGRILGLFQTAGRRFLRFDWDGDRIAQAVLVLPDGREQFVARYIYEHGVLVDVRDDVGSLERYTYDTNVRLTRIDYCSGASHSMRYDNKGRCIYVTGADRYDERSLKYDVHGKTTFITDSHGDVTRCSYNADNQVVHQRSPLGSEHWFEFDADGRPSATFGATGGKITTAYDEEGRTCLVTLPDERTRAFSHDAQHRVTSYTDESGACTRFEYDEDHNIVRVVLPDGTEWRYDWTAFGECSTIRNPFGHSKSFYYDEFRNLTEESDWQGNVWRSSYNALGQCVSRSDPLGQITQYTYSPRNDLYRVTEPDGRNWERHADREGRQITYIRPDGRKSFLYFSSCGLLTEIQDEEGRRTEYRWDTEPGRLLSVTDASSHSYRFDYDAEGHVTRRRTFDGRTIIHRWDKGLLRETVDAAGDVIGWQYDRMDRPVRRRSRDGNTDLEYDDAGNLARIQTGDAVTEFKYDAFGNCIEEIQDGVLLQRQFDAIGNVTRFRAPGFDDETQFAFDRNGDCIGIERRGLQLQLKRDALGREIRRTFPGQAGGFEQSYDPVGRLLGQMHVPKASRADNEIRREIEYDVSGALKVLRDSVRGTRTFVHDATDTLVGVLHPDGSDETFTYDASENRTRRAHGFRARGEVTIETAVFDRARLRQLISHESTVRYGYDEAGRTIRKTVQKGETEAVTHFAWNTKGQLTSATLPNGDVWRYRYDGFGRRTAKVAPDGRETRFIWDGYRIAYHREGTNRPTAWVYLPDELCPAVRDDGTPLYLLPDPMGAPSEAIDENGKLRHAVQKGTWGEDFNGGPVLQPANGQWFDEETGLHYNVYRYYDPETSRYLSPDPIGLHGGINEYAGVPSPVLWRDPLGLAAKTGQAACDPAELAARQKAAAEALAPLKKRFPNAKVGFRGSLARGKKGKHKKEAPFNPNDFDVDAFVVSDELAAKIPPNKDNFRNLARLPENADLLKELKPRVQSIPGIRAGDTFKVRVFSEEEYANKVGADERYLVP